MKEKYIVEGANFKATVLIDADLFNRKGDAYMDACTTVMERLYRNGPDTDEEFELIMDEGEEDPGFGVIMSCYKDGDEDSEDSHFWMRTKKIAENAGITEVANHFAEVEKGVSTWGIK